MAVVLHGVGDFFRLVAAFLCEGFYSILHGDRIMATQMPCRSRLRDAQAVRRELCGVALGLTVGNMNLFERLVVVVGCSFLPE